MVRVSLLHKPCVGSDRENPLKTPPITSLRGGNAVGKGERHAIEQIPAQFLASDTIQRLQFSSSRERKLYDRDQHRVGAFEIITRGELAEHWCQHNARANASDTFALRASDSDRGLPGSRRGIPSR